MLMARVKPDARWSIITACSGREFTKRDWRQVPAGMEAEAEANPYLETAVSKAAAANPKRAPRKAGARADASAPPAAEPEGAEQPTAEAGTEAEAGEPSAPPAKSAGSRKPPAKSAGRSRGRRGGGP